MSDFASELRRNVERFNRDTEFVAPNVSDNNKRWAEAVRGGKIFFYSTQPVEIGLKNIDWTGAHLKHQEWPAQLNRFFWLPHLAVVYAATADEEMPRLARATIEDWIDQHDYSAAAPPSKGDNTLNISIRLGQGEFGGWWGTAAAFSRSRYFDEAFLEKMRRSTQGQMECLAHHLHTRGNWRISHLDCLLYVGLVAPGLDQYVSMAVRELSACFYRQIGADGSHEEHNPSYHGWMCNVFTRLWKLSQNRPEIGLKIDTRRMAHMWDYLVCSAAPDGGSPGLHDGEPWRATNRQVNSEIARRDAIVKRAGLENDPEFDLSKQPSRYFADAGQIFFRDSWRTDATWLNFDATRWGGVHCHLSRLSVNLFAKGRMLLLDPGSFTYEMSDPFAIYCKSTPAHNTINLGGLSQSEADPVNTAMHVYSRASIASSHYEGGYFPGEYSWGWYYGKGKGVYGRHHRAVLWLHGRGILVYDTINCESDGQPFAAHWQFPAGAAKLDAAKREAWTADKNLGNVMVRVIDSNLDVNVSLHEGEREPIRGFFPNRPGDYVPAPMLRIAGNSNILTPVMVTLIVPFDGSAPPAVRVESLHPTGGASLFRVVWPDGGESLVASTQRLAAPIGRVGPIETDGSLAVVSRENGRVTESLVYDGLCLAIDGRAVIDEKTAGNYERVE